ncbi:hypothetical protein Emed_003009 [Eimeria media]
MKVTQGLICLSLVPSLSLFASAANNEKDELVDAGLKNLLVLSEFLNAEDRELLQEELRAAALEALKTEDKVLVQVYPQLFRFATALRDDVAAHSVLRRVVAQPVEEVSPEAFFEVTERCAESETLLEGIVSEMKTNMDAAISAVAAEEKQEVQEVQKRYAPLTGFLNALFLSLRIRKGQAHLLQARRSLERAFQQGKLDVQDAIVLLTEKLQTIYSNLHEHDQMLLAAARHAHEGGVLFKAAHSFIQGIMKAEGAF